MFPYQMLMITNTSKFLWVKCIAHGPGIEITSYDVCAVGIETIPNMVYGVGTNDNIIKTTPNEVYGIS